MSNIQSFESFNEEKNWIKGAIKKPGSLRKALHKKKGEKISKTEIDTELQALRGKDRDPEKSGLQLNKKDVRKHKKLILARTFKSMHEDVEFDNGIGSFFDDLQTIKELSDKILEMESDIDEQAIADFDLSPIKSQLQNIYDTLSDDGLEPRLPEDIDDMELIEDEDDEMPLSDVDMPIKDKGMLSNPPFDSDSRIDNFDDFDQEIGGSNDYAYKM